MYKYIMARLKVNLTLLGVLATLPLSQGHGLVASTVARPTEDDPSPVRSYHLHVQFVAGAAASTAKALKLRRAYAAKWGNRTCTGLFNQDGLCLYPVDHAPNGPFISANWAAYVPTETYEAVLAWITRRRGDLSILFHPFRAVWKSNFRRPTPSTRHSLVDSHTGTRGTWSTTTSATRRGWAGPGPSTSSRSSGAARTPWRPAPSGSATTARAVAGARRN